MKKLFFISLLIATTCFAANVKASPPPRPFPPSGGFQGGRPDDSADRVFYRSTSPEEARQEALSMIQEAAESYSQTPSDRHFLMYTRMYNHLSRATITNGSQRACGDKTINGQSTAAYAVPGTYVIYICAWDNMFPELLIHETAHLSGVYNECGADAWTASIGKINGVQRIRGGYDDICLRH